ncbi:MAG TPA: citrate/2-methylcitrate synthase, partial [Bacteroidia bacterium]|nr:citrate/2-methylcitrate synthase [Bacteroidia bacterium]
MDKLKEKFESKIDPLVSKIKNLVTEHGDTIIGEYTVKQVYSGLKGVIGMVTETSKLDSEEGIRFRGYSIPELREKLPKAKGGVEPLPEGIFYLMLIGELPSDDDAADVSNQWARRSHVPKHVFDVLDRLPVTTHPMSQLSIAIMAMQTESVFANAYRKGINKKLYWDPMYEDVMNLIARLPRIAAYIYRRVYKNNVHIEPDPK